VSATVCFENEPIQEIEEECIQVLQKILGEVEISEIQTTRLFDALPIFEPGYQAHVFPL
jgi:protoporphyrinogen oxidase